MWDRIKSQAGEYQKDIFIAAVVFLVGMASFGLGRISVVWQTYPPVEITDPSGQLIKNTGATVSGPHIQALEASQTISTQQVAASEAQVVASKNGTAYHLMTCPGALQIKDANKVYFKTRADAEAAGYKAAGNCPGLKK
jgi:hypothetical protein